MAARRLGERGHIAETGRMTKPANGSQTGGRMFTPSVIACGRAPTTAHGSAWIQRDAAPAQDITSSASSFRKEAM